MSRIKLHKVTAFLGVLFALSFMQCTSKQNASSEQAETKIGVLLVNHGSHSPTWRQALLDLDSNVRETILEHAAIHDVKTGFMEYTEPSIATRMKEFDAEGFSDVIIVPIFLTVSSHSFDDIPTIIGQKMDPQSMETLKIEKIERYEAQARCHITPLLDFTEILQKNILRRVKAMAGSGSTEGLALIAYGDEGYNTEWSNLMDTVGTYILENTDVQNYSYNWCGHIAHYNPDSTTVAINEVLAESEKALVMPVLVAHDEMFQVKIIGNGISNIENHEEKVVYKPDAILPDENIEQWVIDIVSEYVDKI